jgi:hypothetical protein
VAAKASRAAARAAVRKLLQATADPDGRGLLLRGDEFTLHPLTLAEATSALDREHSAALAVAAAVNPQPDQRTQHIPPLGAASQQRITASRAGANQQRTTAPGGGASQRRFAPPDRAGQQRIGARHPASQPHVAAPSGSDPQHCAMVGGVGQVSPGPEPDLGQLIPLLLRLARLGDTVGSRLADHPDPRVRRSAAIVAARAYPLLLGLDG